MSKSIYTDTEKLERSKRLAQVVSKINQTHGMNSVLDLSMKPQIMEVISSGSISLDVAIGVGGFPRGRIIEIYGPESSGKTTIAIHAMAECQKAGGIAAIIDAEQAFDRYYAECVGVNVNELKISQPDNGEQALEIADMLISSNAVDLLVIDSVAALVPKAELEGDMGDSKVGLHARLMSQAMRKLTGSIRRTKCTVIFINQLRDKIGITFGNPETTTGGNALKFYASIRLDVRRESQPVKDREGDAIASKVKVKVIKNKVAPPFREATFEIEFGRGIAIEGELLDLGEKLAIIQKNGNHYSYGEIKIGNGRDTAKKFLRDNPELVDELKDIIIESCFETPDLEESESM